MIPKAIKVSITKTYIKKLTLIHGEYEWAENGYHRELWTYYDLPYIQKNQPIYKD